jgi:large subunit ribosomal protein L5e
MAFVKIIKNKAYSMRMQVKPKRRRQGKTDYYARRRLVCQDKNKYDSKKYRLVVRRTCSKIITQIVFSTMTGDKVLCAAESQELAQHGLTAGLTNYSAAYATGLLLARRLLKQVGLADQYKANSKFDGDVYNVEAAGDRRPFKAILDIGITRTTTGNRVFGALKGACDGGIDIPHKTKRFPGFHVQKEEAVKNKRGKVEKAASKSEGTFDPKVHRARIFGNHVQNYMNTLKKEDPEKFKRQFSQWDKCLTAAKVKTVEELYKKVHSAVIANPDRKKKAGNAKPTRKVLSQGPAKVLQNSKGNKWVKHIRLTNQQRNDRVVARFNACAQRN